MLYNYFKNHFWFETGLEFVGQAIVFVYMQNEFDTGGFDPFSHIVRHFGDPWMTILLSSVGAICISFAIWDVHWLHAREVMAGLAQFVATLIFVGFLWHAISMPIKSPDALTATLYSFIVVFRIGNNLVKPAILFRSDLKDLKGGVKRDK
ncbi:hypothetical protein LOOC260_109990 [Paucilactobacillus hokkaidonensis JCM 18461]|uniref:Uncharacterized protein n=2 Tax=Paucilactobacillus hokkaidonensis TaxID=1193095 RepID=A0A0A1GX68_9LACO|nr:hypothetical protein [Paucilactobacillus hokkaidonensis]BAP85538.1 hypothetical protein LOOC260_109990 [Paucilactobacillus hokkaidonensis JCM 18461]